MNKQKKRRKKKTLGPYWIDNQQYIRVKLRVNGEFYDVKPQKCLKTRGGLSVGNDFDHLDVPILQQALKASEKWISKQMCRPL